MLLKTSVDILCFLTRLGCHLPLLFLARFCLVRSLLGGGCLFAFLPGIPTDLRVETGYLFLTLQPSAAQSKNQQAMAVLGWNVGPLLFSSGTHSSLLGLVSDLLEGQSPGFNVCMCQGSLPHAGHGGDLQRWL